MSSRVRFATEGKYLTSEAKLSQDGVYRYMLERTWEQSPKILVTCGVNPSTASAEVDDPTILKEISYAKAWGFGGLRKVNLFAFRATDPAELHYAATTLDMDVVGPENDHYLHYATLGRRVLCAWGKNGRLFDREAAVLKLLAERDLFCLGTNNDGTPKHTLYLKGDLVPVPFKGGAS